MGPRLFQTVPSPVAKGRRGFRESGVFREAGGLVRPVLRRPALEGPEFANGRQAARRSSAGTGLPSGVPLAREHPGQQVGGVELPEALLGDHEELPDQRRGTVDLLEPLAAEVRSRTAANGLSTTFVVRRCLQCPAGKSKNAVIRSQSPARISTALG